ncbi:MAG: ribosome biogenesis GTPase YlqF [Mogibacterium sp.]|nr:ribosome biogenesis GTPase YlqF [Mogibacterium sp.]
MIEHINWYPGHMKKTRELIQANLKAVDVVIEIVDSRIPVSSRNPIINELIGQKRRIVVLGKADLADAAATRAWAEVFRREGHRVLEMNNQTGENVKKLYRLLDEIQEERNAERSMTRPIRMMIVGVPNVGKSSLINRLTARKSAKTGDRPGVTKGKQWVTLENGMQLLDTPGILWPKFEDPEVGLNLAFCGSIKDEILNTQDLGLELIRVLGQRYPEKMQERYRLDEVTEDALENMEAIARKRGFLLPGKRIDYERTGRTVIDEFRAGKIGRITLEPPVLNASEESETV